MRGNNGLLIVLMLMAGGLAWYVYGRKGGPYDSVGFRNIAAGGAAALHELNPTDAAVPGFSQNPTEGYT